MNDVTEIGNCIELKRVEFAQMDEKEWVQCDACKKWRGLKREEFKAIVDNDTWYCCQNPDKERSHCDAPQEMTDSEIDAIYKRRELKSKVKSFVYPVIWQEINSNVYTYKRRKSLKEDDIAICQCRPKSGKGCLENCINRILNIECTPGFCQCGSACRNQRFFLCQHADVEIQHAGAKGYGLFSKTCIEEGEFVTEYMGEILDEIEYLRRRTFYAETGHKHYYFMQIGNGEVIDACRMGNAGRFMNHSCDPNCETQKWLVKGDLRVGFFTTKKVQPGEELTFNYNFQTEKPIRCFCGSSNCTGSIGGNANGHHAVSNGHRKYEETAIQQLPNSTNKEDMSDLGKEILETPAPIMLREDEIDDVLRLFLSQQVGLFHENACSHEQMRDRLMGLYRSHGYSNLAENLLSEDISKMQLTATKTILEQQGSTSSGEIFEKNNRFRDPTSSASSSNRNPSRKRGRGRGKCLSTSSSLERNPSVLSSGSKVRAGKIYVKQSSIAHRFKNDSYRRRSEVDLSLDDITAESGKLYNPSRRNIVKVLRLFNLIEIGKNEKERIEAEQVKEKEEKRREEFRKARKILVATTPPSPPPSPPPPPPPTKFDCSADGDVSAQTVYCVDQTQKEEVLSARQRSHFADLSLLLDVVLNTVDPVARSLFIKCGLLSQLQQVIGRNFAPQYSVILRKILRVVDCLPLKISDFEKTRSSHGNMGHLIIALSKHKDNGVRKIASTITQHHCLVTDSHSKDTLNTQPLPNGWYASNGTENRYESSNSYPNRQNSSPCGVYGHYRSKTNISRSQEGSGRRQFSNYCPNESVHHSQDCTRGNLNHVVSSGLNNRYGFSPQPPPPLPPPPPPPPPYPPHDKSQDESCDYTGSDLSRSNASLPPGFGQSSRSQSGFRERESENLSRVTQFSKPCDFQNKRHLRRDSPASYICPEKRKPLSLRIIRKVQSCSQPGQKEGLFCNELGKTFEISKKAQLEISAKEAKDLEEEKRKRQKLISDHESSSNRAITSPNIATTTAANELEGWDHLNQEFRQFVSQTLRRRIQKYQQPEHPLKLRYEEAEALFNKLYESIICIEENAFGSFARDKMRRHVSKSKLELNIKEFTRRTMHQFYDTRTLL